MPEALIPTSARAFLQRPTVCWMERAVSDPFHDTVITRTIIASQARTLHTAQAIKLGRNCTNLCEFVLLLARQSALSFSQFLQARVQHPFVSSSAAQRFLAICML